MNRGFLATLQNLLMTPFFADEDLKILFPEKDGSKIYNSLSYHLKKENIVRFKRGIYALADAKNLSKFKLANILSSNSCVSFESALSHHSLIPEAVHEITSACFSSKKRSFKNSMGIFSFRPSPVRPFFLEVEKDEHTGALIASPIRALFDLIYSRRKNYDSLKDLENDFRIDLHELRKVVEEYDASDIFKLGAYYKKRSTRRLAEVLVRELM